MTQISITINLDRYAPSEIIEFCERGIISINEIIESGVMNRVFGPELRNYVATKTKNIKSKREDTTCEMDKGWLSKER